MFKENYITKLENVRNEMFEISLELKRMFDEAFDSKSKRTVNKTIKTIKKLQEKCYKFIDRKKLNDYHGGSHKCYPGGCVETYRFHTDRQNVRDFIDYFFINDCSNSEEFNKKYSCKLHPYEYGESYGPFCYNSHKYPKEFYDANCWEEILLRKDKDLLNLINVPSLTQERINEINQEYCK